MKAARDTEFDGVGGSDGDCLGQRKSFLQRDLATTMVSEWLASDQFNGLARPSKLHALDKMLADGAIVEDSHRKTPCLYCGGKYFSRFLCYKCYKDPSGTPAAAVAAAADAAAWAKVNTTAAVAKESRRRIPVKRSAPEVGPPAKHRRCA